MCARRSDLLPSHIQHQQKGLLNGKLLFNGFKSNSFRSFFFLLENETKKKKNIKKQF